MEERLYATRLSAVPSGAPRSVVEAALAGSRKRAKWAPGPAPQVSQRETVAAAAVSVSLLWVFVLFPVVVGRQGERGQDGGGGGPG